MDTVYGTKKYFQSLSGASDIYRTQACRTLNQHQQHLQHYNHDYYIYEEQYEQQQEQQQHYHHQQQQQQQQHIQKANDYNYQNTLGRRSTLGAYYHMNKQPAAYTNDHSLNSQYGYNTWGIWRDGRNIAPSTFSAKTHAHYQKSRSFSIILTTAAFIVLLAVISIAGLAFYFSSIKANMEDPVLGFEGSFRIAKGDLYSTGLKYNHTTTYKQKIEFYKRFVERALTDNGLQPMRIDVWGFGDGPLIKVSFRTFFDVRKLPQNIHSVEDYIKESLFLETTAVKSLYRSLRIDAESVEIKRILDEQVVKSASLFKEAAVPTSQTQLEKRLMKKGGNTPALLSKSGSSTGKPRTTPRSHSADEEPEIDVENAPVIQGSFEGSFEITKTDADIARKKTTPTKAYSSLPPKAVTPFPLRVKPKKPSIEKLTTIIPQQHHSPPTTTSASTTSTTSTTTTTTTTTTRKPTTTTTTSTTTTSTPAPTPKLTTTSTSTTTTSSTTTARPPPTKGSYPNQFTFPSLTTPSSNMLVPKLDTNLFTSIPVLDTQPWRPIHREVPELVPGPPPAFPTKTVPIIQPHFVKDIPQRRIDEIELPFMPDNPSPPTPSFNPYGTGFFGGSLRRPDSGENAANPPDVMLYHSFGNPVFMPGSDDIERLGIGAHVQPHPLPVPLIDDVVVPSFRPISPTLGTSDKMPFEIEADDEKFEHLGGGVIAKKHDDRDDNEEATLLEITSPMTTTTAVTSNPPPLKMDVYDESSKTNTTADVVGIGVTSSSAIGAPTANSELADTIGEFFMDFLNLPKEEPNATLPDEPIESRIEPDEINESQSVKPIDVPEEIDPTTAKPTFLNLKEIILRRKQAANQTRQQSEAATTTTLAPTTTTSTVRVETTTATSAATTTKRNRIRPTHRKPPAILDGTSLFPSHSKWEFVNSSSTANFGHTGNMRRVFNKTLQAWVSEDVEKTENLTLHDIKTRINNATNIQDISLIFDTLATKLGITPSVPAKVPPFAYNKLKYSPETRAKVTTTSTTTTSTTTTPTPPPPTTTTTALTSEGPPSSSEPPTPAATTTTTQYIELPIQRREPFIKPMSSFMDVDTASQEGFGASIPVVGEAEVEVIDPNKYEEMLKSSQFADVSTTQTAPKLVTLLPVRSNSGIRTYKPIEEQRSSGTAASIGPTSSSSSKNSDAVITRKSNIGQSRLFPPAEAIVKGGLSVKVK